MQCAAIDHLFVTLGLTFAECRGAGFFDRDVAADRCGVVSLSNASKWPPSSTTAMETAQPLACASSRAAPSIRLTSVWVSTALIFMELSGVVIIEWCSV